MKKFILPVLLMLISCSREKVCKRVKKVGACTEDARCGVEFEDGYYGRAYFPIEGRLHCNSGGTYYFPLEKQ